MSDKEYPEAAEPNACGGYYCSEEHGHIDCQNPLMKGNEMVGPGGSTAKVPLEPLFQVYQCETAGVSGTTPCKVVCHPDGTFEARMGGAMLGQANMTDEQMAAANYDPFHPDWHDNYFCGKGKTKAEAISAMKKDMQSLCDLLWA